MNAVVQLEKQSSLSIEDTEQFEKCIRNSKRVRWDIDTDVIRGRQFDITRKFLPDGLSMVDKIRFLLPNEMRLLSQIQGRTYVNVFGLVERFICAKILEISQDYYFGNQVALEALVRFSDEELKHQELFRRMDKMAENQMPHGYQFLPDPNDVAKAVLGKSTWSVLGLTLHIELFTQVHYKESIDPQAEICSLWKDVFKYHWLEESQHAVMDAIEWVNEDKNLSDKERDIAVNDLIALVGAVDGILQVQAKQDVDYFVQLCRERFTNSEVTELNKQVLAAYRWQYILSGAQVPRFAEVLGSLITNEQANRIGDALGSLQ